MVNWECPEDVAHVFDIGLDDHCVEVIKKLTHAPSQNAQENIDRASTYRRRDGTPVNWTPPAGELIAATCLKCGRQAIVALKWIP